MGALSQLHRPAGSLASGRLAVDLTPDRAGWSSAGLAVAQLAAGEPLQLATGGREMAVLPLAGSLDVCIGGAMLRLAGRDSVFSAVSDWVYLPVDTEAQLVSAGGCLVALPSAPASRRFEAVRVPASAVPIEIRGAGACTRQVTNFMTPESFAGAERLMCVEVLTPDGNCSSYPPHCHDDSPGCPVNNEEIYYFRVGRLDGPSPSSVGMGMHCVYTADRVINECMVIRDGDVCLVPRGFHGPSVALPGYPLYYLNVLASPGSARSMAFCDDPAHHWVRDSWSGELTDPRCPMTGAVEGS